MARTLLFCHSDLDPLTRITSPGKALSKCIEKNGTLSVYRGFSAFLLFGLAQSAITGSLLALSGGDADKINKLALGILPLGALALYPLEAILRNIQVGNLGLVAEKVCYRGRQTHAQGTQTRPCRTRLLAGQRGSRRGLGLADSRGRE